MEFATDAYLNAMKENVRGKSYVWISLDLVNTYAQDSAYISSAFTGNEVNIYTDAVADSGVTSSELDGSITFTFGEYTKLLLSGASIILGNDPLPENVIISNGTTSATVTVNEAAIMLDKKFQNCSYLKITPNTGALNIIKIRFGCTLEFDNDLIMNTNRRNTIRHLNDELPMKEFSFTIHNYDRLWNRDNPNAYGQFIQEKQKITYKYGRMINDEDMYEINGGIVYLKDCSSDDYQSTFSCVGLLDYLQDDYTKGRFYPEGITLYQLAEYVLQDAGIILYELDAVLRTFIVTNPLPVDTHKACLQMIAHAGRCVLYEDRNGAVCIKSIDRPEILKTAILYDATSFSSGDDVINPITVANYGSTEPEYTKADGLHYFFPEETVLTDNYAKPYDIPSGTVINDVTLDYDEDGIIHIYGRNSYYGIRGVNFILRNYTLTLDPGTYVFGAYPDTSPESIQRGYGTPTQGWDLNAHGCNVTLYYRGNFIYSYDNYSKRTFTLTNQVNIQLYILCFDRDTDIRFYPRIIKTSEDIIQQKDTLPVGFVSEEFANASGTFTTTPKIQINFKSPCTLSDVVMNCAVAPKNFTIKVFKANNQVAIQSVIDNTNPQITKTFNDIKCDRVDIQFTKTTPYQRIHVNNVELGATIDYLLEYHDMTATPKATPIEKISNMIFELLTYTSLTNEGRNIALGNPSIQYNEIDGGGLSADLSLGSNSLLMIDVKAGENHIEIGAPAIVSNVEYQDGIEGGTCSIISSGAYYVDVECSRDGKIAVMGIEFMENIATYEFKVNEIGNPVKVTNPLISTKEHADRLKDWFLDYYNNDIEYGIRYRGDPILDAHDQIYIENKFVDDNLVRIETEELSTSNGMDTSNSMTARRLSYKMKSDYYVLKDFTLSKFFITINIEDTEQLFVTTWVPSDALNKVVTWSSSDSSVAIVDANGVVTGVAKGNAVITATSANNISKTCYAIIEDPYELQDFELSAYQLTLYIGDTETITVEEWIPSDARDRTVSWSSSNTNVATIDSEGVITGVSYGIAIIYATSLNGITKTCSISVLEEPPEEEEEE